MATNILCENEESTILSGLFEELSAILQDSDDQYEKEKIQDGLQKLTDTTAYLVLGEDGVGKTSVLRMLFQDVLALPDYLTGDICEYRWGAQTFETPVSGGFQKKFVPSDKMKGISIIDTRGLNRMRDGSFGKLSSLVSGCDAVFAVLDAQNIRSPKLWDMLECLTGKKIIFFLTKCDAAPPKLLTENIEKIKVYMKEGRITAPVFPVSLAEGRKHPEIVSWESVRSYIRHEVVGENPMLNKQRQNVAEAKSMLAQLQKSFILRKRQYESDAKILQKVNAALDGYIFQHRGILLDFTEKLAGDIHKDIDLYEQEILSKMDPYKIKERFQTKEDFAAYLNMVNDNYKSMMDDSINRKTIETMKGCLHDLEILFQEAVGYFNQRENILELNDRFFGSLSQSRRQIVAKTKESAAMAGEFYQLLEGSSQELFLKIWKERKRYDSQIGMRKALSLVGGGGAGSMAGAAGAGSLAAWTTAGVSGALGSSAAAGAAGTLAGALVGTIAAVGMVGLGVIVGTVAVNSLAKRLYDPKAAGKMEAATKECIRQFQEETEKARKTMVQQVSNEIMDLFEKELASVDSCFTDFRLSVNQEERRLPALEQKINTVGMLMEQMEQWQRI